VASVPQYIDAIKVAWTQCNPRAPFPAALEIAGRRNPDEPEGDPVQAAGRRERARAAVRRYQERHRGARQPVAPADAAQDVQPVDPVEAARRERLRAGMRAYWQRRRAAAAA
jgi:hypothetical protein